MLRADPAPEECFAALESRSPILWDREPGDTDFASVRLGTGTVPLSVTLVQPREQSMEEKDELNKKAKEIYNTEYGGLGGSTVPDQVWQQETE